MFGRSLFVDISCMVVFGKAILVVLSWKGFLVGLFRQVFFVRDYLIGFYWSGFLVEESL